VKICQAFGWDGTSKVAGVVVLSICAFVVSPATADDWPRFLGANGDATGVDADVPTKWSASTNVKWKAAIPGPGGSSPIVLGDRVYLTCYTGYGVNKVVDRKTSDKRAGNIKDLTRHLICFDRSTGDIVWKKPVDNKGVKNEDPYKSFITYHGYATNTPITDGKSIFAFFGKAGVVAFDLEGNERWRRTFEGTPNKERWGSASSPIFYGDQLIVNAIDECGKILSINKSDGKIKWEFDAGSRMAYSTPNLVKTKDGTTELVVAVPEKVYGIDPDTGKQKWHANTTLINEVNASIMVEGDIAFIYGGYQGVGSLAVRAGGKGDVSKSHVLWSSRDTSYVSTPVVKEKHIYWIDKLGIAYCVNAETGARIYRQRVPGVSAGTGVKFFASNLLVGDRIVSVSRTSGTFIWSANPNKFELVSQNVIEGDDSPFNGTPAISDNQLFLRSNKFLYCISK
jgi:outer membrane protein assembly factor BamB